jgi:diguanylate cyclase (GGDEF)-like protein
VLKEVGDLLRRSIRNIDVPVRYGGDEFVVLLPETDKVHARHAAERLRAGMQRTSFLSGMGLDVRVTASFGIATCPEDGDSTDKLVKSADAAMYRVKESTRNGVGEPGA